MMDCCPAAGDTGVSLRPLGMYLCRVFTLPVTVSIVALFGYMAMVCIWWWHWSVARSNFLGPGFYWMRLLSLERLVGLVGLLSFNSQHADRSLIV